MPITVSWDNDEFPILRIVVFDHWTLDDFNIAWQESIDLSSEVDFNFDGLIVYLKGETIPPADILTPFQRMVMDDMPAWPVVPLVVVHADFMARKMFESIHSLNRDKARPLYFADTLDDARDIIINGAL